MTTLLLVFSLLYFFPLHCKYNTIYTLFPSLYFSILNYLFIHAQISQIVSPCTHLLQTPLLFSPLLLEILEISSIIFLVSNPIVPQILTRTRTTPTNTSTPIRPTANPYPNPNYSYQHFYPYPSCPNSSVHSSYFFNSSWLTELHISI